MRQLRKFLIGQGTVMCLLAAAFIAMIVVPAWAQQAEDGAQQADGALEEIVVTARRAAESLGDVPIAVTAFTSSDIEDAGIQRPEDFINLTPNVVMANTVNVGDTLVTIRGLTSTRDAESNFALVVDGVLVTNPNAFNRELLDIAQIEVLKGPQGALYGRNATSGAILLTTREPDGEASGSISFGRGNNELQRMQGSFTMPMADNLNLRLAFSHRKTDGEKVNLYDGKKNVDFFEDLSLRGRLVYEISDNSSLDFRFGQSQADGGTINFNATFALPLFAAAFSQPKFLIDVNDHQFRYMFNVPPLNEQETQDFAVKFDHALDSGYEITAIAAFNKLDEQLLSDGTSASFGIYSALPTCAASHTEETGRLINASPPAFISSTPGYAPNASDVIPAYTPLSCDGYQYQERNQKDISFEARVASPADGKLRWIAGAYMAEIEREVVVAYGADLGRGFRPQPYVSPQGPNPTDLLFWDDFGTSVFSLFGQLNWDLSDSLELSFEARYDSEDREVDNMVPTTRRAYAAYGITSLNPARGSTGVEAIPSRKADFSQFQPKLAVRWNAAEHTSLYGSYGIGFRSGGFNSQGSRGLINFWFGEEAPLAIENTTAVNAGLQVSDEYDKEVSTAIEFGLKGNYLDGRLKANFALFQTVIEDNQFFEFFAGPFGLMRVVTTIDELELFGAEFDFTYQVLDSLRLYGSIGVVDGEIVENRHRPYTEGNEAPLAPENTANLGLQWSNPLAGGSELVARLDVNHVGATWFHTVQKNTQPSIWSSLLTLDVIQSDMSKTRRDAYMTVDARLSLHAEAWSLSAWGRNLNDEDYLSEVIPAPEFGGSFIHEAPERTLGIDFSYRF